MDIEFHYYTNYIIALAAGFSNEAAYKIAYSVQLLDDNTSKHTITLPNGIAYTNEISQTFDITMPVKRLYRIYRCFHFLPGDNSRIPYQTTPNCIRAISDVKHDCRWRQSRLPVFFLGSIKHYFLCSLIN